jgi:acetylornithine aminotransferase
MGELIRDGLGERLRGVAAVRDIRGVGLMIGVELDRPCGELVSRAIERGVLLNVTADNVVRLLPPLILQPAEARLLIDTVAGLIHAFLGELAVAD